MLGKPNLNYKDTIVQILSSLTLKILTIQLLVKVQNNENSLTLLGRKEMGEATHLHICTTRYVQGCS